MERKGKERKAEEWSGEELNRKPEERTLMNDDDDDDGIETGE